MAASSRSSHPHRHARHDHAHEHPARDHGGHHHSHDQHSHDHPRDHSPSSAPSSAPSRALAAESGRFSLIALSAFQRLALTVVPVAMLWAITFWALRHG